MQGTKSEKASPRTQLQGPRQRVDVHQKWPTSGLGGYIAPAIWGVPTASERGTKSEVAHKWAWWLHHPCRRTFPNSKKKKQEMGCYTQNPKTVVPGWVLPLFSLGYPGLWDCSPFLQRHTNVKQLDSGIAVHSYKGMHMWISWTPQLQSIAQTCRPTRHNFRLFKPTSFVINQSCVHNSE